jgi:hypothetical protein
MPPWHRTDIGISRAVPIGGLTGPSQLRKSVQFNNDSVQFKCPTPRRSQNIPALIRRTQVWQSRQTSYAKHLDCTDAQEPRFIYADSIACSAARM